jgi:hypothetical protein
MKILKVVMLSGLVVFGAALATKKVDPVSVAVKAADGDPICVPGGPRCR